MKDEQLQHPPKWRETCDPFALRYHRFQPLAVLGYPHAGNDVFYTRGIYDGQEVNAFVKVARQSGADIENEIAILKQLRLECVPKVIDHGDGFSVTLEIPGERLSTILGENEHLLSLSYMEEYGAALAELHGMKISAGNVKDRRFFHKPSTKLLAKLNLKFMEEYFTREPYKESRCFCHGDFHYANLLWKGGHISGILDFELAGYGNRDFDIAWALLVRPGQKFLKTEDEQQAFLKGYGACDLKAVLYYMAQSYVYFLEICGDDEAYCAFVRDWLAKQAERQA